MNKSKIEKIIIETVCSDSGCKDYLHCDERQECGTYQFALKTENLIIEKACEFLKDNLCFYVHTVKVCGVDCPAVSTESLIKNFKKAMTMED